MDNYVSNVSGTRINPATEGKQQDLESRLEEMKLLNADLVNALAASPMANETQKLTNGTANSDAYVTVEAGGVYVFTALVTGGLYFGLADTQVVSNVRWVAPLHQSCLIKIPVNETELHYATDTNSSIGYLRRIA